VSDDELNEMRRELHQARLQVARDQFLHATSAAGVLACSAATSVVLGYFGTAIFFAGWFGFLLSDSLRLHRAWMHRKRWMTMAGYQ
jgi:hypothetical protein